MPRQEHLHAMKRVFRYLKQNYKFSVDYDIKELDFSMHKIEEYDLFPFYGSTKEEEPYGMPEPKGKSAVTSGFFDYSHASCLMTRSTPIHWYFKQQNYVETSTYGFVIDLAIEMRYNLRILGAPVKGTTELFGDNKSMITKTSLPHST
eukprot:1436739-Ditylum_brightwellii.AAC.1